MAPAEVSTQQMNDAIGSAVAGKPTRDELNTAIAGTSNNTNAVELLAAAASQATIIAKINKLIAHCVAHHRGGVQFGALGAEVRLDDLPGVVPRAAGVGHEDGPVEAEDRDGDQLPKSVKNQELTQFYGLLGAADLDSCVLVTVPSGA